MKLLYIYFSKIGHSDPAVNVMIFVRYKGLNNCVSPEFIRVDNASKGNSHASDNGPLSLQLWEEAPNK